MKRFHRRTLFVVGMVTAAAPVHAQRVASDPGPERAYLEAVARHFGVPAAEADVLARSLGSVEAVPVLLLLSARAGVSPDVIGALRGRGARWEVLARRFRIDPWSLVVPLGGASAPRGLERVYAPRAADGLALEDAEIVALVHVRMFSALLDVPVPALVGRTVWTGDYPRVLRELGAGPRGGR